MIEVIEGPVDPIVTLTEMKQHLRVDFTDDDELIQAFIAAAEQRLDGPSGICGRAFRVQRLRASFPGFGREICLPYPPVIEVEGIAYLDSNEDEQTFAEAGNWRVVGLGTETGATILPLYGVEWPSVLAQAAPDLVRVTYRAGYYSAASPDDDKVPKTIRHAIKLIVGDWYEHRNSSVIGTTAAPLPQGAEMLIAPFRSAGAYMAA